MGRETLKRSPVAFFAWSSVAGRSREIAGALGGDSKCFFDFGFVSSRTIPLRYLASGLRTVLFLLVRRPRALIATDPPIFPGLIAYLYGLLSGSPVVLDSHPSAFGLDGASRVARYTRPIQKFLTPRVAGVMVTEERLAERVAELGGRAIIVHEAEPSWRLPPPAPLGPRPKVLLVGIFAPDEPVHLVIEAAARLPEVDFEVTGDLRKCPPPLREAAGANVHFLGFLDQERYLEAIARANLVITLTERPEDVSRVACEAVSARRPLLVSDWPAARRYFPHAVPVENSVDGVAAAVARALGEYGRLVAESEDALAEQQRRWRSQLAALRELTGARGGEGCARR